MESGKFNIIFNRKAGIVSATCDLNKDIECDATDLEKAIDGWIVAYAKSQDKELSKYKLTRKDNAFYVSEIEFNNL